jgi:ribonuclease P/MRP protein subunit RPP40
LGPLLFLIYINDLPDKIKSQCRLFADDSLLYRKIITENDHIELQNDLNEVMEWCNKWNMKLNLEKCEYMQVSSKRCPTKHQYSLSNGTLKKVSDYKYLGLNIADSLNWNKHINSVISKGNKILYVTKLALSRSSRAVKEAAYKSIVRPCLEYSSSVWDPFHQGQINSVEMVQRKAARFCLNRYKKIDSVSDMLKELNWDPLSTRRKASRLAVFSRVYKNEECLQDLNFYIKRAPCERLRHVHPHRVQYINCHKEIGHYSFLPRSIREWNVLPKQLLTQDSIESSSNFRSLLLHR